MRDPPRICTNPGRREPTCLEIPRLHVCKKRPFTLSGRLGVLLKDRAGSDSSPQETLYVKMTSIAFFAAGLGALLHSMSSVAQTHTGRFIDPIYTMSGACSSDTTCNTEAEKYLQAIGVYQPNSTTGTADRGTSTAWKTTMGFSTVKGTLNPGEIRAVYWNAGDLALGRDMHCIIKKVTGGLFGLKSQTFACYVTNYRENTNVPSGNVFTGSPNVAQSIVDAASNVPPSMAGQALATVAMEQTFTYPRLISAALPPINFIAFDELNGGTERSDDR